jgi:hypothetical protein
MPYDSQEEQSEQNEHFMKEHDMVFSKSEDGTITGGGFTIESMLLKNITANLDPMIGGNNQHANNMAVPFGLFYKQEKNLHKNFECYLLYIYFTNLEKVFE